jgi:hypothetical protein
MALGRRQTYTNPASSMKKARETFTHVQFLHVALCLKKLIPISEIYSQSVYLSRNIYKYVNIITQLTRCGEEWVGES